MRIVSCRHGLEIHSHDQSMAVDGHSKDAQFHFLTHAHSDHAQLRKDFEYRSTPETKALLEKKNLRDQIKEIHFGKKIPFDDAEVSFHPSGHILGSAQVLVEGWKTIVATGDFKLEDSLLLKGAKVLPCDSLVMESTFGRPEYSFPSRAIIYEGMAKWAKRALADGHRVVLAGYSLGKAQELTKFVNEYLDEIPFVHEKIFAFNQVYENHGAPVGDYGLLNGSLNEADIIILPSTSMSYHLLHALRVSSSKRLSTAVASGWGVKGYYDRAFPLSDHADFKGLVEYAEQSGAKEILINHGFADEFARALRSKGLNAKPLGSQKQKTLAEFA